jgi:hypothetical protein
MVAEPALVVARLARAFESAGIAYVVGGSFASSLYGIPRATQDVDIVADLHGDEVDALVGALVGEFFVDTDAVRDAVRRTGSFNLLHKTTMFKADVFVSPQDEWSRERLKRARKERFKTSEGPVEVCFSSPEDTLLHKLVWYRLGNEVSERQWRDVVGLLKIQKEHLDEAYLNHWASVLEVQDLLRRGRTERGA